MAVSPLVDFDGNLNSDILWQNANGQLALWNLSGSTILASATFANLGPTYAVRGAADLGGDGRSDIVFQNVSGQVAIVTVAPINQNGTTVATGALVNTNPGPTWHVMALGDFDNDGKSDILWQNNSGQVAVWLMNGSSITGSGVLHENPGPTWHVKGAADFDGDGKADILWQNDSGQGRSG